VSTVGERVASVPELEERGSEAIDALRAARIPVLIWGHPLGTHTHSWIHYGFARAFEHLGFDVLWLEDAAKSVRRIADLERAIVLVEGQEDQHLLTALKPSWIVFGHNCEPDQYRAAHYIPLYVQMLDESGYRNPRWHPEVTQEASKGASEELSEEVDPKGIAILWATDLLPDEIVFTPHRHDSRDVVFVGSVWAYNKSTLKDFRRAVRSRGLKWKVHKNVDQTRHAELIRRARFAPSIQGEWQVDHGYIPCRLFKNVSYSQLAISNNPSASAILSEDQMICDRDLQTLVDNMLEVERSGRIDEMVRAAQSTVRLHHTYVNRINQLVGFAATVHPEALTGLVRLATHRDNPR
jgi:hypothetical protein